MRFAIGVDDDLTEFHRAFRADPLIGPAISRRPWLRPRRRPFAWEALAWAITKQLIESGRAAEIQRRIVRRWGEQRDLAVPAGLDAPRRARRRRRSRPALAGRAGRDGPVAGARAGDDQGRPRGRRAAAPTRPTRRRPPVPARSARSAPGRSSASASTGAASPTRSPPATSATSSSSAASPASAAARRSRRSRSTSRRTRPSGAWRASSRWRHYHAAVGRRPARARGCKGAAGAPQVAGRRPACPATGLARQAGRCVRMSPVCGQRLDQAVVGHEVGEPRPLLRVHDSRRACPCRSGRGAAASGRSRPASASGRGPCRRRGSRWSRPAGWRGARVPRSSAAMKSWIVLRVVGDRVVGGDERRARRRSGPRAVDRHDPRMEAALGEVDALDVEEAAEHRVGAAGDDGRQQALLRRRPTLTSLAPSPARLEDRLQEGRLVGDPGGGDRLALQVGDVLIPALASEISEVSGCGTIAATALTAGPGRGRASPRARRRSRGRRGPRRPP